MKKYDLIVAELAISLAKNDSSNTHKVDTDALREKLRANGAILEI